LTDPSASLLHAPAAPSRRGGTPAEVGTQTGWIARSSEEVTFALALFPFAGLAFLWFVRVVRGRFGAMED